MNICKILHKTNELGIDLFCFSQMIQALEIAAEAVEGNSIKTINTWSVLSGLRIQLAAIEGRHQELDVLVRGIK